MVAATDGTDGTDDEATRQRLVASFPGLRRMDAEAVERLVASSTTVQLPAGARVVQPGDPCETCTLVIDGELKVHTESASGRALTLYSVVPGQMCALTSLSLVSGQPFPAYVDVVAPTTALVVPRVQFTTLLGSQESWRRYAFGEAWQRVNELLGLIDQVLFTDLPTRLSQHLLTVQEAGVVLATHEQLAQDVGSSREAVSRVLKRWEGDGLVALERARVRVVDRERMCRLAQ